jgi:hypothetical protein
MMDGRSKRITWSKLLAGRGRTDDGVDTPIHATPSARQGRSDPSTPRHPLISQIEQGTRVLSQPREEKEKKNKDQPNRRRSQQECSGKEKSSHKKKGSTITRESISSGTESLLIWGLISLFFRQRKAQTQENPSPAEQKAAYLDDELADVAGVENVVHGGELVQLRRREVGREDAPRPPANACRADSRVAAVRRPGRATWGTPWNSTTRARLTSAK